ALDAPDLRRGKLLGAASHWLASLRQQQRHHTSSGRRTELRVLHVAGGEMELATVLGALKQETAWLRDQPAVATHVEVTRRVVWGGAPGEQIVNVAEQQISDLVILGMGERGPLLRA